MPEAKIQCNTLYLARNAEVQAGVLENRTTKVDFHTPLWCSRLLFLYT